MVSDNNRLAKALERANDLRFVFLRGIVVGIGTAIGATIIATVLIGAGLKIVRAVGMESMLEKVGLERVGN